MMSVPVLTLLALSDSDRADSRDLRPDSSGSGASSHWISLGRMGQVARTGHDSYPRAIRETLGDDVTHRCSPYLNNRLEQDHRGIKQRSYPMRGFGNIDAAARFCRAFDEQRHYFRMRPALRERVPPLSDQRREYCARFQALMGELMAA